jgi:hypothetical protein
MVFLAHAAVLNDCVSSGLFMPSHLPVLTDERASRTGGSAENVSTRADYVSACGRKRSLLADWIKPDNSLLASPIVGGLKGAAGRRD